MRVTSPHSSDRTHIAFEGRYDPRVTHHRYHCTSCQYSMDRRLTMPPAALSAQQRSTRGRQTAARHSACSSSRRTQTQVDAPTSCRQEERTSWPAPLVTCSLCQYASGMVARIMPMTIATLIAVIMFLFPLCFVQYGDVMPPFPQSIPSSSMCSRKRHRIGTSELCPEHWAYFFHRCPYLHMVQRARGAPWN